VTSGSMFGSATGGGTPATPLALDLGAASGPGHNVLSGRAPPQTEITVISTTPPAHTGDGAVPPCAISRTSPPVARPTSRSTRTSSRPAFPSQQRWRCSPRIFSGSVLAPSAQPSVKKADTSEENEPRLRRAAPFKRGRPGWGATFAVPPREGGAEIREARRQAYPSHARHRHGRSAFAASCRPWRCTPPNDGIIGPRRIAPYFSILRDDRSPMERIAGKRT
jgi:hypothetical protein